MGTLLYPSETLARGIMNNWFLTNTKLTTKEFQTLLKNTYPDYDWSFLFCSKFLCQNTASSIVEKGATYYSLQNALKEPMISAISLLSKVSAPVTKKNIKTILLQYNIDAYNTVDFENCFLGLNLKHTGQYTSENHKIYSLC